MGGFFGAISKRDCVLDIFFGVDYHSHLGTRRGGMAIYDTASGFQRQIHNIENAPFRTKFEGDLAGFHGTSGIGCISDTDPQPLLIRSHLGLYAITTVGIINNTDELIETHFSGPGHQFLAQSSGKVNSSELIAALINQKGSLLEGIRYAQEVVDGSATILLLTPEGRYVVELFSGYVADTAESAWTLDFSDEQAYQAWLEEVVEKSAFSSEVSPGAEDRVVTLSTCSYEFENARFVLHGVLQPEEG